MGGGMMRRAVPLILISVLLVGTACTRPKPQTAQEDATPQAEEAASTMQPTPGQTVLSVPETHTPSPAPASEVPGEALATPLSTLTPTPTAMATPIPEAPPVPLGSTDTHIVQRGETLFSIGQRYGVPWQDIAQTNGIAPPYQIVVGQELTIPRGGVPVESSGGRIHVVQPGENLFRIGLKYGVPWQDIAQANGILNPTQVLVGQKLVIP